MISSVAMLFMLLFSCTSTLQPDSGEMVRWIGKEELLAILANPALILLDARYGKDWKRSDRKIRNAERLDASEVDSWEGRYPLDQKIVIYCA